MTCQDTNSPSMTPPRRAETLAPTSRVSSDTLALNSVFTVLEDSTQYYFANVIAINQILLILTCISPHAFFRSENSRSASVTGLYPFSCGGWLFHIDSGPVEMDSPGTYSVCRSTFSHCATVTSSHETDAVQGLFGRLDSYPPGANFAVDVALLRRVLCISTLYYGQFP
jgi:hypothetical protein